MTSQQRNRRLSQLPRRIELDLSTGCWNWTGYIDPRSGYGRMRTEEGNLYVHRMVYELAYGEIEPGFDLHHECENKRCANPTRGEHCLIHMPPGCRWEKARAREAA